MITLVFILNSNVGITLTLTTIQASRSGGFGNGSLSTLVDDLTSPKGFRVIKLQPSPPLSFPSMSLWLLYKLGYLKMEFESSCI